MVLLEDVWHARCAHLKPSGAQIAPPFVFKIICTPCGSIQFGATYIKRLGWNSVLSNVCKGARCSKAAGTDQTDIAGGRVLQSGATMDTVL